MPHASRRRRGLVLDLAPKRVGVDKHGGHVVGAVKVEQERVDARVGAERVQIEWRVLAKRYERERFAFERLERSRLDAHLFEVDDLEERETGYVGEEAGGELAGRLQAEAKLRRELGVGEERAIESGQIVHVDFAELRY